MKSNDKWALVVPEQFIQAVRDSGYKNFASAIAELVDNALEAQADRIKISVECPNNEITVCVADNGSGMSAATLRHALQFGWSSRFNCRNGFGRYGMGLPNASLSVARRVEVYSRVVSRGAHMAALDVDGICAGKSIGRPRAVQAVAFSKANPFSHGTSVVWRKCDRLAGARLPALLKRSRRELGRLFRYQLWSGKRISLNGDRVQPVDPLFERKGDNLAGARRFGPELRYEIVIPGGDTRTSIVRVRFTELPVNRWHEFSNAEKNTHGIAKNAGVSVVRAGREIDRGWYFMGDKRKENYDDWWRCEVRFEPELDDLFGLTHSKQEIRPTEALTSILAPEIEAIARVLNGRVRAEFVHAKRNASRRPSERQAQLRDGLLEPPQSHRRGCNAIVPEVRVGRSTCVAGIEYRLRTEAGLNGCFFRPHFAARRLTIFLNKEHAFVERAFGNGNGLGSATRRDLELLLLAAARAELMVATRNKSKMCLAQFRQRWSKVLTAFYG
jgi:hypothetical protein